MITITVEADVPDEKMLYAFLGVVRAFDRTWPGCHFRVVAAGGDQSMGEMVQMLEALGLEIKFAQRREPP